jgi:hypothetical protein
VAAGWSQGCYRDGEAKTWAVASLVIDVKANPGGLLSLSDIYQFTFSGRINLLDFGWNMGRTINMI